MKHIITLGLVAFLALQLKAQTPCTSFPTVSIQASSNQVCLGNSITLTASGGTHYSWNKNVENGVSFTPSTTEYYTVTVTDAAGCSASDSIEIEVLSLPNTLANSSSLNICLGDSIQLVASNAQSYVWINPAINNGDYYTPTQAGVNTFEVEGTATNGCTKTSQVIVVVKENPVAPTVNQTRVATCLNIEFSESIEATATEGRVFWFTDAALTNGYDDINQLVVPNTEVVQTNYYASAFLGGCYSTPVEVEVEVYALPVVSGGPNITATAGDYIELVGTAPTAVSMEWGPTEYVNSPYTLSTMLVANNTLTYTLTVEDANTCVNSSSVTVTVATELTISNVVTPNFDGNNDVWKIYPTLVIESCAVRVFDGFGRILFETDSYTQPWDGTYNGEALPDGDYYYEIVGNNIEHKGTITLIH